MAENRYLLKMDCDKCGASIDLDIDNLISFCPYCGNKLLVDPVAFKEVLTEREKTKRLNMAYEHEKEMTEAKLQRRARRTKTMVILFTLALICFFLIFFVKDMMDGMLAVFLFIISSVLLIGAIVEGIMVLPSQKDWKEGNY